MSSVHEQWTHQRAPSTRDMEGGLGLVDSARGIANHGVNSTDAAIT
jgi:hypothetical protein